MAPLSPHFIDLIGYAAAGLTTLAFVPQVVRTWRSRSAGDLSAGMLAAFTCGVFLWLVYGLARGAWPVIAANAVTLVLSGALVMMRWRFSASTELESARANGVSDRVRE